MKKYSAPSKTVPTVFIGIDNGSSGSIGVIEFGNGVTCTKTIFMKPPIFMKQDYTKKRKRISQIDVRALRNLFKEYRGWAVRIAMERPLVNPGRWVATATGLRVHQQYLDVIYFLGFPDPVSLDSKEWQKVLLPKGTKGEELKARSKEIGNRLFPSTKDVRHPDCDGMLIAEWLKRQHVLGG